MNERIRTGTAATGRPLHEEYDTALLDLDGVVYAGGHAVEHAVPALREARADGMHLAFVTNNSSRTPRTVAEHLTELGVAASPEDVITSAQAVARMMADRFPRGARVLVVGGRGLRDAVREQGFEPVESADDDPVAVVQGYDPELGWRRLAEVAYAVGRGVPWFASNTDRTLPTERGRAPGNGALVEAVRVATGGAPEVAGKPRPPMHRETILRTGARRPLVVGDRLDTDIEGAHVGGVDSLLVLTGVTGPDALLTAPPEHRPTYVASDLRGLLAPQPAVEPSGDGVRCGDWTAEVRDGAAVLEGSGDPDDGLRALCAVVWTEAGDGPGRTGTRKALDRLGL